MVGGCGARVQTLLAMRLFSLQADREILQLACYALQLPERQAPAYDGAAARGNLRKRAEEAAEMLLGELGGATDNADDTLLERVARLLHQLPQPKPVLAEARLLADAVNLEDFSVIGLLQQTIGFARQGGGIAQISDSLAKREQYGYWEARLRGGFHYEPGRRLAASAWNICAASPLYSKANWRKIIKRETRSASSMDCADGPVGPASCATAAWRLTASAILAVDDAQRLRRRFPDAVVEQLGDVILLPGLVNAHVHLELSDHSCGPLPEGGLAAWLFAMPQRAAIEPPHLAAKVQEAVALGIEQCLRFGVTSVGDISRVCQACASQSGEFSAARHQLWRSSGHGAEPGIARRSIDRRAGGGLRRPFANWFDAPRRIRSSRRAIAAA